MTGQIVRVWKRHNGDGWYRTITSDRRNESFPDSAAVDRAAARHGLAVQWDRPVDGEFVRSWLLTPVDASGYAGELADICARLDEATDTISTLHGHPDERDVDHAEQIVRRAATDLERVIKAIRGEAVA